MITNMSQMADKFNAEHDGHIEIVPPDEWIQEIRGKTVMLKGVIWSNDVSISIRKMYVRLLNPPQRKVPRSDRLPRGQREYL